MVPSSSLACLTVSALLVPFCFSPSDLWPFVLVSQLLLFFAILGVTPRWAFYVGLAHGTVGYGLTLSWFTNIFGWRAVGLFMMLGLFTAVQCLATRAIVARNRPGVIRAVAVAVIWVGIEFYRCELFYLRFPWVTTGTAIGPTALSPIVGVYGTSFLAVLGCACTIPKETRRYGYLLLALLLLLGVVRLPSVELTPADSVSVALVQDESSLLDVYTEYTEKLLAESRPDLVVWPEYAVTDPRDRRAALARVTALCERTGVVLVYGTRTQVVGGPDWWNTARTVDASGVRGDYHKARPVHLFNDGVPGRRFDAIETAVGTIGTPICFDCDYTEVLRQITANGAEFFAVPSRDNEEWSERQHWQHAQLFRLRAAENGRWIACAASSGVSQLIDPHGNVTAQLDALEEGTLVGRVGRDRRRTWFVRGGWVLPWVILGGAVGVALYLLVTLIRERRAKEAEITPGLLEYPD